MSGTEEGRRKIRVLVGGVFDILHVGHIHFLSQAKALGDELIVIVAHDETVRRQKRREPVNSAEDRAEFPLCELRYLVYGGVWCARLYPSHVLGDPLA